MLKLGCIPIGMGASSLSTLGTDCHIVRGKDRLTKKCSRGGLMDCAKLITGMARGAGNLGATAGGRGKSFDFSTEIGGKSRSKVGSRTLGATPATRGTKLAMGRTDKSCKRFLEISLAKGCNSLKSGLRAIA